MHHIHVMFHVMCKCKLWCMKYLHNNDKQDLGFYSIFILDFTTWHTKCLENNIKSQYHILSTEQWVFPSPEAPEFGLLRRLQPTEVYYSCSTVTNMWRRGRAWYTQAHNTERNFKITVLVFKLILLVFYINFLEKSHSPDNKLILYVNTTQNNIPQSLKLIMLTSNFILLCFNSYMISCPCWDTLIWTPVLTSSTHHYEDRWGHTALKGMWQVNSSG